MDKDILEIFKEKNKSILINSLKYDIEKNITSLLETITNIFNNEFDTAIKNIISIYEDGTVPDTKFIIDTVNNLKADSYKEIEILLETKKLELEKNTELIEFEEKSMKEYYDFVLETTKNLKTELHKYCIINIQNEGMEKFKNNIEYTIYIDNEELLVKRIEDYIMNRLYGKLETKIHMEIMLRDNNLINKAKEGYQRYQEICAKTEEK